MKRNNKGYSFMELILTMAIFSIVMLAIILMMRTLLRHGKLFFSQKELKAVVRN